MAPSPRLNYLVTDQVPPFPKWQFPLHLSYSIEWPTLISDMEGTESFHHDRMAQPLHLTYSSEWITDSALISDMEGTNPLTMTEWLSPYI